MLAAAGSNEIRIWDPEAAMLDGNDFMAGAAYCMASSHILR